MLEYFRELGNSSFGTQFCGVVEEMSGGDGDTMDQLETGAPSPSTLQPDDVPKVQSTVLSLENVLYS